MTSPSEKRDQGGANASAVPVRIFDAEQPELSSPDAPFHADQRRSGGMVPLHSGTPNHHGTRNGPGRCGPGRCVTTCGSAGRVADDLDGDPRSAPIDPECHLATGP